MSIIEIDKTIEHLKQEIKLLKVMKKEPVLSELKDIRRWKLEDKMARKEYLEEKR